MGTAEKKTECYSYFCIESKGEIINGKGLVSAPNGGFDPEYITKRLGIEPFRAWKAGDPRQQGSSRYGFSCWCACRQSEPALDVGKQCQNIVRELREKIPLLLELKREFELEFGISVVPSIYSGESPTLYYDHEVIEFCYLTGTEIGVDIYVYEFQDESDNR